MHMPSAPNRRKRGNVLDSIFSDSQPLPLNEYVKLITKGQIDLLTSPATETEAKAEAGDEENRKEQERREYIQSVFIVPEAQPVILDVLQNDPTPINDVVRKFIAHAIRNKSTVHELSGWGLPLRKETISRCLICLGPSGVRGV